MNPGDLHPSTGKRAMSSTVQSQGSDDTSADTWFKGQLPQLRLALDQLIFWARAQKDGGSVIAIGEIVRAAASALRTHSGPALEAEKKNLVRHVSQNLTREMG